jgi:hypothetical protein
LGTLERPDRNELSMNLIEAIQISPDLRYVDGAMMQEESG